MVSILYMRKTELQEVKYFVQFLQLVIYAAEIESKPFWPQKLCTQLIVPFCLYAL